jgi:ferric-dicitrate binding protein FerR (iron transport regulator)
MSMEKELLQRYIEGNVTPEEIRTVVNWLNASAGNVREYRILHKLYDISVLNRAGLPPTVVRRYSAVRKIVRELVKIAAVFAVALASLHFLDRQPAQILPTAFHTLIVPAGQRAELILSDSTKVWLNAGSRLVYPAVFADGKREIMLDGEGFFEVTPDAAHPFVVKTKAMDIQALGTEFNVVAYDSYSTIEVALLKGSVALKPVGSGKTYRMRVNECVRWRDGNFLASAIRNFDYFKWKEGLICFDEATVGSIMEKLELYFDVKINVQRQRFLDYHYTGKFRSKDGVEQVLKVLQLEHRFTYIRDNEKNIVTIK